jgi:hypothetical protein
VPQGMQEPTDMGWMVGNAPRAPDDLGYALAGPDVPTEAVRFRTAFQERWQLSKLLNREARLPTKCGMASQALQALLASPLEPLTDGTGCDPEGCGDALLLPALLFQLPGASPPSFAPVELGCLCAHGVSASSL